MDKAPKSPSYFNFPGRGESYESKPMFIGSYDDDDTNSKDDEMIEL
jgi:hypothetical protein